MLGSQKRLQRFLLLSSDSPSLPQVSKLLYEERQNSASGSEHHAPVTDKEEGDMGTGIEITLKFISNHKHHKGGETVRQKGVLKGSLVLRLIKVLCVASLFRVKSSCWRCPKRLGADGICSTCA